MKKIYNLLSSFTFLYNNAFIMQVSKLNIVSLPVVQSPAISTANA